MIEKDQIASISQELKDTINKLEREKEKYVRENETLKSSIKNKYGVATSKLNFGPTAPENKYIFTKGPRFGSTANKTN
jgi:hypothetical protein